LPVSWFKILGFKDNKSIIDELLEKSFFIILVLNPK